MWGAFGGNQHDWVDYLSALLAPTIAAIALYIAWRQWRTAQNRLKLDLFDRRWSVYEAAREFLSETLNQNDISAKGMARFYTAYRQAKWLLSDEVEAYLWSDIHVKAVELDTLRKVTNPMPAGPERSNNVNKERELRDWLGHQYNVLDDKFAPYLKLRH